MQKELASADKIILFLLIIFDIILVSLKIDVHAFHELF